MGLSYRRIYAWILALVLAVMVVQVRAAECRLRVAATASFRPALEQLLPQFEAVSRCRVQVVSGSSGALYQQILHGAPFDLFLSADRQRPELLEDQGRTLPESRSTYALGLLALWLPDGEQKPEHLLRAWQHKIVLADPKLAPFGIAARQLLNTLAVWNSKQKQLARAHNASQAFLLLNSGSAQLGFVAASQMLATGRENFWLPPQEWYQPIEQQLVILKRSRNHQAAQALADYLLSEIVRAQLVALGYGLSAEHRQ